MTTSELVTPAHLARKALIYIRQSTPSSVDQRGNGETPSQLLHILANCACARAAEPLSAGRCEPAFISRRDHNLILLSTVNIQNDKQYHLEQRILFHFLLVGELHLLRPE
jgi:hypothetical protein